jgi:hypothetical protein
MIFAGYPIRVFMNENTLRYIEWKEYDFHSTKPKRMSLYRSPGYSFGASVPAELKPICVGRRLYI